MPRKSAKKRQQEPARSDAMASETDNLNGKPEPLTVRQVDAARIAGVSERTLRRWERDKKIKGKRVGGVKLYPYADLKKLVS